MQRVLTAAVLIPVVLLGIFGGSWWALLAVITAISVLTFLEYAQILQIGPAATALGLAGGLVFLASPLDWTFVVLVALGLLAVAAPLAAEDLRAAWAQSAAMFLGCVYVFGAFKTGYLLGLRNPWWLLFALVINWIGDSGAYYVGRQFGRHKLAPRISPGKSWEGSIASVVFSTLFFVLAAPRFLPMALPVAGLIALAGNVAGQFGDLAESALKRAVGVKDSGTLLPGHGGMLDRVDSALFTLPVIYGLAIGMRL